MSGADSDQPGQVSQRVPGLVLGQVVASGRDNQRGAGSNSPPPFAASTVEVVCRALG